MTDEQKGYLQALSDVRSWHRWQIGQSLGDYMDNVAHLIARKRTTAHPPLG